MDNNEYRIVPFSFKGFRFRSIIFNNDPTNNPWFINKEICDYLGINNSSDAINKAHLEEYERITLAISEGIPSRGNPNMNKAGLANSEVSSNGVRHTQNMTVISESGLYKLIGNSRKPNAIEFQNWIYGVVIPCIRRYGAYIEPELRNQLSQNPNLVNDLTNKIEDYEKQIAERDAQIVDLNSQLFEEQHKLDRIRPDGKRLLYYPLDDDNNILVHAIKENYKKIDELRDTMITMIGGSNSYIDIGHLAKIIWNSGDNVDIGRNRLYTMLVTDGFIMRSADGYYVPTQRANGYLITVEDRSHIILVTPEGQEFFINKYKDIRL